MRALRPLVLVGVACAGVLLAACGSSSPSTTSSLPSPGVGANLAQVQKFFEKQGGGRWQPGAFTGGIVGYAVYKGQNAACPVSLNGTIDNINNIHLFCSFSGAVASNPQQAESIITATVDRFAPGASAWVRTQLMTDLAPNTTTSQNVKKVAGKNAVTLTRGAGPAGELNLTIQPEQLTLLPPGQTTTTT